MTNDECSDQKGMHPEGASQSCCYSLIPATPFRVDSIFGGLVPGVSLRSTPGYLLAALLADVHCAWLRALQGQPDLARADLDEAQQIAECGSNAKAPGRGDATDAPTTSSLRTFASLR